MLTTASRLVTGSVFRVVALLANVLVALYIMPFVVHAVGDRWYGIWALVGSIMGYYSLLDLGIQSATQRFLAVALGKSEIREVHTIIFTSLILLSIAGLVAILISIGISAIVPQFITDPVEIKTFQLILLILGVNVALTLLLAVFTGTITAHARYDLTSLIVIGKLAIQTTLTILLINRGHGIVALAIITLVTNIIGGASTVWTASHLIGGLRLTRKYFRRHHVSELLNFGVYAFISRVAYIVRFGIDNLVISAFLNLSLVTHYAIAARLAGFFQSFMISSLGVMTPVFAAHLGSGEIEKIRTKFLQATRIGAIISMSVAGAILIFGKPFINTWMGQEYSDAYLPLVFLVMSLSIACLQIPSTNLLYALAKHKFHAIMNVLEALVNLLLSIILVRSYGILGVAIGTAVPMMVTRLFVYPVYVCSQIKVFSSTYYFEVFRIVAWTGAAQLPLWFMQQSLQFESFFSMFVVSLIYYSFYGPVILRICLNVEDRITLVNAVPKFRQHLAFLLGV
jgi:O-antigen/teichoic acid export membrane protein